MTKEEVIKGYEICSYPHDWENPEPEYDCCNCPYFERDNQPCKNAEKLREDVLAILKGK